MGKRQVVVDCRVKMQVSIPDKVPDTRKVEYAEKYVKKELLLLEGKGSISSLVIIVNKK